MKRNHRGRALPALTAGLLAASLAGCSIGPVTLPDLDLSAIPFLNGLVTTTSVADAEAALKEKRSSAVDPSELLEQGVLTVGVLPTSTVPFYTTTDDGQEGVNVEFSYALADHMGLGVKFVTITDTATSLGSTCDVVVGVSTSEAGSTEGVAVLGDYAETAIGLFGKTSEGAASASGLEGKVVAIQPGSVSARALAEADLGNTEQGFANINDAMEALGAGSVDYVVCDAYSGSYLAADYEGVGLVGTLDTPVAIGVAVSTSKATLASAVQSAVDAVQSNGQLDVIKARWVNGVPTLTAASRLQGLDAAAGGGASADAGADDAAAQPDDAAAGEADSAADAQAGA